MDHQDSPSAQHAHFEQQQQQQPQKVPQPAPTSASLPSPFSPISSSPPTFPPGAPSSNSTSAASNSRLNSQSSASSLRNIPHGPPSPRVSSRHPSMSAQSMADILAQPPPPPKQDPGTRDWRTVSVGELVKGQSLTFVDQDTTVEDACLLLIEKNLASVPIRTSPTDASVCGTFDYSDLTAFLLLVMGVYQPEDDQDTSSFQEITRKARAGSAVPVKLVQDLGKKTPIVMLSESEGLAKVVEVFGSGVHRIAVVKEGTNQAIGILSQLQLVTFFWEHGRSFPSVDQLYPCVLKELNIGSSGVISINGDKRVIEALELMNTEGVSSLAVVDNQNNVVGNISTADVKYLTRSSSVPILKSTCLHFLSVILTDRGTENGQDSYPVFHVNPMSTLAHTVAKLVATKAHRMWLVEAPSPASSAPPTPTVSHAMTIPPPAVASTSPSQPTPFSLASAAPSLSSASLPGHRLSGRLIGVISLTDILNLFARSSGLSPVDPNEARRQRRRSSSSSMQRMSFDMPRSSFELRRPPGASSGVVAPPAPSAGGGQGQ